jgi:nitrous oxide reductase accessory protein NosL
VFLSWPEDDRAKATWHHIWRRQECQHCGTREEEWDEAQGGHRHAYAAEPRRCRGCEVKEAAQQTVTPEHGRGVYITLIRNEEVARGNP